MGSEGPGAKGRGGTAAHFPGMKERVRKIVDHRAFGATVFVLIVVSVGLLAWELAVPENTPLHRWLVEAQAVITWLFVVELALRWTVCRSTSRFLREYWIDILAVLPLLRVFRLGRAFRLLRLLRLLRLPNLMDRHLRVLGFLLRGRGAEYLLYLFLIGFALVAGTLALAAFERGSLPQAFWDSVFALFSGEFGSSQPRTLEGKLTALFLMFAGLGFFAVVTGTVSAVMVEKLKEGAVLSRMSLDELEGHVVVCGWNSGVETLLLELQRSPDFGRQEIVVIAERDSLPEMPGLPDPSRVRHVQDDFTRVEVLSRANVKRAAVAVIVSDTAQGRSRQDADARTVLAALTIEKLNPKVYTCAELSNAMNEPHLRMGKVDQVVVTRQLAGCMLAQAALHSSAVVLLKDLMRGTVGASLAPSPLDSDLVGQLFEDILSPFRKRRREVPVAVVHADGRLSVNPDGYRLQAGDSLICLATRAE